jgi:hypothetical protein
MKVLGTLVAGIAMVGATTLALPPAAQAQAPKAGTVTTLQGTATVTRVSLAAPAPPALPLKFRDDVFQRDRIATGDDSLARILLGGKAVVTVRERSVLTITETATTATIDITAGKIALAVAKDRLRPGESVDVKTPNAIAGVRGTVLIAEVLQTTAQAGGTPPGSVTSRFTLLSGIVDVSLLDPSTGRAGTSRFTLNPLQQIGITGFTPPPGVRNISRGEGQALASTYGAKLKDPPKGTHAQVSDRQVQLAGNAVSGGGGGGGKDSINTLTQGGPVGAGVGKPPVSGDDTRNSGSGSGSTGGGMDKKPVVICQFCECGPSGCGARFRR